MDTQIRRATQAAAVTPAASVMRPTLSLPTREVIAAAPALAPAVRSPAVVLAQLRHAILRCADEATRAEPNDTDARLHSFMAKLSGSMESIGQRDLDTALWDLLSTTAPVTSARAGM